MRSPDPRRWCSGCGLVDDDTPAAGHPEYCGRHPRPRPFAWELVLAAVLVLFCLAAAIGIVGRICYQ